MSVIVTRQYFGNSQGGAYTTIAGGLTQTVTGGAILLGLFAGIALSDAGVATDNNGTFTKEASAYTNEYSSARTYGGVQRQFNATGGSHTVTPPVIGGGTDGIFYWIEIDGLPTSTVAKYANAKIQATSAQTFSITTDSTPAVGDLVVGIRFHENSAPSTTTFSAKPSWDQDFGSYTDGATNLPTNAGFYTVVTPGVQTLTWTVNDPAITDTTGAVIVFAGLGGTSVAWLKA